jgi:glycosyltransferase involved in cell wall biosynthesis
MRKSKVEVDTPLVTIGLTCFNARDTIVRAVSSVLAQDWPNIEVLVVDDASTDDSLARAQAAIAGDPRVRIIGHQRNTGPGGARHTIVSNAKGEFVAFFDDDDESLPSRISKQVATLIAYEQRTGARLVACYASGIRRYPNGYILSLPAIGSRGAEAPSGPSVADYLLIYRRRTGWCYGSGTPACALIARRRTFTAAGGFDANLRRLEDADFAIRLAMLGGHFVGSAEKLFVQYATSAADKAPEKNLEAQLRLAAKNESYLRSIGRYYYARHWPKLGYWHFKRHYGRFLLELAGLCARHPAEVTAQLLTTGPRRLLHERRIRAGG